MTERYDAIVIGAGEAGALIASLAVDAGKRVALVYREPYGSTCLNVGCVPSKYLLHRARVAHQVRSAREFGVNATVSGVDLAAIVRAKNAMLDEHRRESLASAIKEEHVTLVAGGARFRSAHEVTVDDRVLTAERIFIATGMRPAVPDIEGLDRVRHFTNEDLMDEMTVPARLIVVGGGYVACELGQAYARFGSRVTIVQSRERLLPDEEPDVSTVLADAFETEGITVVLGRRASQVERVGEEIRLTLRAHDGATSVVTGTHLLIAAGRRPNTDALGLDAAGIATDKKGFVRVDEHLATSAPGVYAAGDVLGKQPFTRVSQEEGRVAFANAFGPERAVLDRRPLGHAVFTDPEIASVGLTEAAAREAKHQVEVGYVTFDQVTKAELIGKTDGFIKYVIDAKTRRLLGAHVIGPQSADLLHGAMLVMRHDLPIDALADTVGIFPTLQEGMEGSARGLIARMRASEGDEHRELIMATSSHMACPECNAELASSESVHLRRG